MLEIGTRSQKTNRISEGAIKLCLDLGFAPIREFTLKTGRRADICAINYKGQFLIIEVKSSLEDFKSDRKWQEYLDYCDFFYFAIDTDFPQAAIPQNNGYIIADSFGGQIIRSAITNSLNPQRRKSITLSFARAAALKIHGRAIL